MSNGSNGSIGLIVMNNCKELGQKVDAWIKEIRSEEKSDHSYIIPTEEVRFNNGEGKFRILDSVRGKDLYILSDVGNYHCTYKMFG